MFFLSSSLANFCMENFKCEITHAIKIAFLLSSAQLSRQWASVHVHGRAASLFFSQFLRATPYML